ncbi:MAG: DUF1203 domain-containing protein [Pseudomonadota bacterium]
MNFQINALPKDTFAPLFDLSDADLAARKTRRMVVDTSPGVPCRVSLADAELGETVILTNYEHLPADSPYRSRHAVYIRENAVQATPSVNEVPRMIQRRLLSLRFFNADHMMVHADVVAGEDAAATLSQALDRQDIQYGHIHIAKPGCFAAAVRPLR